MGCKQACYLAVCEKIPEEIADKYPCSLFIVLSSIWYLWLDITILDYEDDGHILGMAGGWGLEWIWVVESFME